MLLLEGKAEDGQDHRALVMQGLPAGWEIAGRFAEGAAPGMPWLGELSDDRGADRPPMTASPRWSR